MGKKKFIDKKKSATFQLLARDTTTLPSAADYDGAAPLEDRVFIRVDNNPYSIPGLTDNHEGDTGADSDDDNDPNSIFADAPGDTDDEDGSCAPPPRKAPLADHVRRQILELGLPDDGYNYLLHLREIKNAGGGAAYFQNNKARLDSVPLDVKAYDASRVRISNPEAGDEKSRDPLYAVAAKTVGIKVQRAVDPDVLRLLDDGDMSRFGSDVEDLDEDFVVKANLPEGDDEPSDEEEVEAFDGLEREKGDYSQVKNGGFDTEDGDDESDDYQKPRVPRLLDEQFDMLTLQEYDSDSDIEEAGFVDPEKESLAAKLKDALKEFPRDDLNLEDKYRLPGDLKRGDQGSKTDEQLDTADVIRRCVEYAEKYYENSENDVEVVVEESSDESEQWDCDTIVSTYSNLDNHPGKIQAPGNPRKKILEKIPEDSNVKSKVIALGGKEKLPLDFLPHNNRSMTKVKTKVTSGADKQRKKPHAEESKEEKKERKAAVKEERREARKAKKELKGLYRCEAQRAQKVAAFTGPSSIHLM